MLTPPPKMTSRCSSAESMNPYDSPPDAPRETDATETRAPNSDPDDLRKKQLALVIRLMVLSVATTLISAMVAVFAGFDLVSSSLLVALILGIGFTVSWKI